jgi:hypothetical protein
MSDTKPLLEKPSVQFSNSMSRFQVVYVIDCIIETVRLQRLELRNIYKSIRDCFWHEVGRSMVNVWWVWCRGVFEI